YLFTVFFCPIFTFLFGWSSYLSSVNPFFLVKIYSLCRFLIFFKEKKQAGQRYLIFAFSANIFRFVNLAPICQSTILSDRTPQSGHLIAFDILVASGMLGSPIALYSKCVGFNNFVVCIFSPCYNILLMIHVFQIVMNTFILKRNSCFVSCTVN